MAALNKNSNNNPSKVCREVFKSPLKIRSSSHQSNQLENPRYIDSGTNPQSKIPVTNLSRTILIETEPPGTHVSGNYKNKNVAFSHPILRSDRGKDHQRSKMADESEDSRMEAKAGVKEAKNPNNDKNDPNELRRVEGKNNSNTDDKFSNYISKVKNKLRTVSNVGAPAPRTVGRRDSFNDKVLNYISRAKIKMRTMTMVGNDNSK